MVLLGISSIINDNDNDNENEKELCNALDEIIQAYLKRSVIGWTGSFSIQKTLDIYRSKSKEIFDYLMNKPNIQNYELMIGRFHYEGFGIEKNKKNDDIAYQWYMKAIENNDIDGYYEAGWCIIIINF